MASRIISTTPFLAWGVINLFIGLWEVYAFNNREQLILEKRTIWEKIGKGEINIYNFWIEGWSEYCKVDSRYIYKPYVWVFELLNAIIAFLFLLGLILETPQVIRFLLILSIYNCMLYFISLLLENLYCQNNNKFARNWQFPIYYLISGIWIIVPAYLLNCM
jgi:hypothetical protein